MTIIEAHEFAMQKVEELRAKGIEVTVKPSRSRNIESTLAKYGNRPDRVPPDRWFHVTFRAKDAEEARLVFEASNYLGLAGMSFDTGGGMGGRDWELDWSFKYTVKEDEKAREGREIVNDLLNDFGF
jgi:hypothetical protein